MQNIVTLGEINDALKIAAVTAAQLADMGFAALANKPICEGLPPEESRRLRNAKLYPAESIGQIRVALAQRLAAPAATTSHRRLGEKTASGTWLVRATTSNFIANSFGRFVLVGSTLPVAAQWSLCIVAPVMPEAGRQRLACRSGQNPHLHKTASPLRPCDQSSA